MNNRLVDIPDDKGVHVKLAGVKKEKYVYKYVHFFRNTDGNPRNKAVLIGKYDPSSGKMFPNLNYYETYKVDPEVPDSTYWEYGYSYLVSKICQDTGLYKCLQAAFGDKAKEIIVMAAYIIREGNAMDGIDDWQKKNYFSGVKHLLTSQSTSRLFASFTQTQQDHFFENWVKIGLTSGSVCYDVTSVSSYAKAMASVERGYNRDGENLDQFNLGMFCDEVTKVPLYYNRYNGSLTDKTNLSYVLDNAKNVGIEHNKIVLDGGFWSQECFENLEDIFDAFTVGMPGYLNEARQLIDEYGTGIENFSNRLKGVPEIYCLSCDKTLYDVPGRVLLYYDTLGHSLQGQSLGTKIDNYQAELEGLSRLPQSKLKRYSPYFIFKEHEQDSGFEFVVDIDKVNSLVKYNGYFLLFSNDMESTPDDLLYYYRAKDADEKIFAQIKVEMEGNRIRTHSEATTNGKTFVTFIACVIRSYLLNGLAGYLAANSLALKKPLSQLSDIVVRNTTQGLRLTKALTKKQKEILSSFDAKDDILASLERK
jgi:transposase